VRWGSARKNPDPGQTNRARATRILKDALHIAQSTTGEYSKALALARVAEAMAATDPDRAERITQSITLEFAKVSALVKIAGI
jgi:hypothetical protein